MVRSSTTPSPLRFALLALLSAVGVAAHAQGNDVRFGGGRTYGLAGAGIALPLDVYETSGLNPALLGFAGTKFRLGVPYLGYHTNRISLGGVNDLISDLNHGSVSDDAAVKLARKYGSDGKELGINAGIGLSDRNFALRFRAEADIRSVPNQSLRGFLATGDDNYLDTPIDARLDAYGLGYYEAGASYGHELPLEGDTHVSLGASVRAVTAYYAHKVADAGAISTGDGVRNGTEISGDDDFIQRSGVGIDFGAVAKLKSVPDAYFGLSARNLVEPDITFVRTMPDTDFPLRRDLRPFKRTIGVGAALVKRRYLFALDAVDLGNHAGAAGVRAGVEYSINKYFAVRGGYDSHSKFVGGVCIGGINAAIAADGTSSIFAQLRF